MGKKICATRPTANRVFSNGSVMFSFKKCFVFDRFVESTDHFVESSGAEFTSVFASTTPLHAPKGERDRRALDRNVNIMIRRIEF